MVEEEHFGIVNVKAEEIEKWINKYRKLYLEVHAGVPGKDVNGNPVSGDYVGIYVRGIKDKKESNLEAVFNRED